MLELMRIRRVVLESGLPRQLAPNTYILRPKQRRAANNPERTIDSGPWYSTNVESRSTGKAPRTQITQG